VIDGQFHRLVAEGSPDLHTVVSADGVFRFVSTASLTLFGWEPDDLVGRHQDAFVHPDDAAVVGDARHGALRESSGTVLTTVCRFRCANGDFRWTEAVSKLVDVAGEQVIVSAVRDIAERKESEVDLQLQATTDPLTGVANRIVFMDRLHQALRRLDRRDGLVAVLFLDLDRFKLINDSVGHLMGDAVLLQMAERLRSVLRPQDTLARLGGDEFAIVVEDIVWAEEAVALGARIIEAGRNSFVVGDEQFMCTTSVGIAMTSDARSSAEGLLQEADLALYRAKDRGRDRAEVFDEDLRTRAVGRLATERMLRRAIDEDRLRLHYQPIVDLHSGKTVAVEALVRVWDPEQANLVKAESFIEVAEEASLLAGMDDWVLRQAIEQATRWRTLFAGTGFADVSINVTARHLADAGFAQSVIDDLAAHDVPAGALQVEVTERVLMEASNSAMSGLKLLRDAGVKVGLDDFGTGYSSLSYLRLFPLDFVKIDQSFIQELALGETERAIVASIIDLSHALGMAVVAEGVETDAQIDVLIALGCDRAQGYLFATPGPPGAIEDRVLRRAPATFGVLDDSGGARSPAAGPTPRRWSVVG
jgi:diguanylate cyclase (GGDEF)-like protein/PAS domain S-box-containing protein